MLTPLHSNTQSRRQKVQRAVFGILFTGLVTVVVTRVYAVYRNNDTLSTDEPLVHIAEETVASNDIFPTDEPLVSVVAGVIVSDDTLLEDEPLPSSDTEGVVVSEYIAQDTPTAEVVASEYIAQYTPQPVEEISEPTETPIPNYLLDDIALSYELQTVAYEAADTYGIPYSILLSVMFKESNYNIDATNGTCWGLMQIHQVNHDWLEELLADKGVTDIQSDPASNIRAGAYMLGTYYEKYGDWNLALMAYNCGEAGAKKLWDQGYYSTEYSRSCIVLADEISLQITER